MSTPEQAPEWFTRLRETELSAAEHKQFAAWLAQSPANMLDYLRIAETWGSLQSRDIWSTDSKEDLYQTIRQAKDANVAQLKIDGDKLENAPNDNMAHARTSKWRWPTYLALAASAAAIAVFGWSQVHESSETYRTALGEQRSIVLPDGSIVELNTLSTLVIDFDKQRRRIKLPRGEAFFRVARDKVRPFDVETPFATVHAVGTEFDVYNRKDATHVLVVEGKVAVTHRAALGEREPALSTGVGQREVQGGATREFVTAGQQIAVGATHLPTPTRGKVTVATAWMQRRIILDGDRVDAAVGEFNRYNAKQIQIQDADLAGVRITGAFNADDPTALVKYLQEIRDLRVIETDRQLILQQ